MMNYFFFKVLIVFLYFTIALKNSEVLLIYRLELKTLIGSDLGYSDVNSDTTLTTSSSSATGTTGVIVATGTTGFQKTIEKTPENSSSSKILLIGLVVGGILLILISIFLIIFYKRKKSNQAKKEIEMKKFDETSENNYSAIGISTDFGLSINMPPLEPFPSADSPVFQEFFSKDLIQYQDLSLESKIGEGGFGVVFKGTWRSSAVAIKQIKNGVTLTDSELAEFLKEAKLMRDLKLHPHVVSFFGLCANPLCIITEYCDRGSLYGVLHNKSYSIDFKRKLKILRDVSAGMYHLSQEGIVHRDLAARNVLLNEGWNAKVSDFGLSRIRDKDSSMVYSKSQVGPLKWMSPESIFKQEYSEKSDVWSFGVLCIEVTTRDDPYPYLSITDFAIKLALEKLSLIGSIPQDIPPSLSKLICDCFQENPVDRPDFETIGRRINEI